MTPYLSVVATARHDDHGGNLLARMQAFLDCLRGQCERFALDAEVVLVEWNPPADRPPLSRVLEGPASPRCPVRIIQVPPAVHNVFPHSDRLPLFQMIAKNVGIRRSRGRFVLATNVDILFSDALVRRLARRRLRGDRMVRVDRHDIASAPTRGVVDEAAMTVLRIHRREGTCDLRSGAFHRIYKPMNWRERLAACGLLTPRTHTRLHTNACGDFTLMHRDRWFELRGYAEFATYSMHLDSLLCHAAHHAGVREQVWPDDCRVYHIEHAAGSGFTPEHRDKLDARLREANVPQITHAQFAAWALQMRSEARPLRFNNEDWGLARYALPEFDGASALRSAA